MKKSVALKLTAFIILTCLFADLLSAPACFMTAGAEANDYDYILKTFDENAYVMFGEEVKENYCEFMDGCSMGITDASNEFYNEKSTELSMDGRKFYKDNYANVRISDSFYEKGDNEFLVSVVYYDYGPSEGRFYFEYFPEGEDKEKRITVVKSGKIQDWFVKTFYISNADLGRCFDSGANVRLVTGAWNLFKKLEIVNISALKREQKAARATLASEKRDSLIRMGILENDHEAFYDKSLNESCNVKDAHMLLNIISGKNPSENLNQYSADETITQGKLLELYMGVLGLKAEGADICGYAKNTGLTYEEDLFLCNDAPATNYNLLALANNALLFTRSDQRSFAADLIDVGILNHRAVCMSGEEKLIAAVFRTPQPCPCEPILDNETGQTYYSMTIYGLPTMRPYVTTQSWTEDGKRLLCSLVSGSAFLYDIQTETLTYVDKIVTEGERLQATIGKDDYIYYSKKQDGEYSIWRADANADGITPELVTNAPAMSWISVPQISNDCNYISVDFTDNAHAFSKPGERTFARYSIKEDKWEVYTHTFDYANVLTHNQVNPQYPDILSFSHEVEGSGIASVYELLDRMWVFDCNTKEAKCIYKQGVRETDGTVIQGATHEVWSNSGEYMYFINYSIDGQRNIGLTPSAVRFNRDGSHRQYYYDSKCFAYQYQHLYASDDDKYIIADGNYIVLISTETNEHFPIAHFVWNNGKSHPYQAHPVIARNRYIVSWGAADDTGLLTVRWFDFTKLASNTAEGAHYSVNEYIDRASYKGLDCESKETTVNGKRALFAKSGKALYLDINDELIDTDNGKVKLSFDYFDNSIQPIRITYTSGVKTDNDCWRVFDAEKSVQRSNTRTWKHCEIIIDSGNFENIGKYETDIRIDGECSDVYIADITAEIPE
ncbi:MAG: hypothetical protein J6N52_10425 [Clostridia bacterium]|nr:hypothetical protein [Clostridia bacterium]